MAGFLANTLTKYKRIIIDGYSISDYKSIDIIKIKLYMSRLPENSFEWYQLQDDDTLERLSLELYGNADYWDILLLLNNKSPLIDMPYNFDTISSKTDISIALFEANLFKNKLPDKEYKMLFDNYQAQQIKDNEASRVIKIIKPSILNKFLQDGYDLGFFK